MIWKMRILQTIGVNYWRILRTNGDKTDSVVEFSYQLCCDDAGKIVNENICSNSS